MKRKIIISICILFVFLISTFFIAHICSNQKVDLFSMDNNQENTEIVKSIELIEVELNSDNCQVSLNEQAQTVQIEEYTGIEDCIIIPEKINDKSVENIDTDAFGDCYNLEKIKLPIKLSEKIEKIPDFEIIETTEEYAIYNTTREYSDGYKEYLNLSDEEKANIGVIPNKYDVPISKIYTPKMEALYTISGIQNEEIADKYDLRDYIDIEVESQLGYGICYAYASLSSVETNLSLTKNEMVDFSEIHAATMTTGYNGTYFNSNSTYYKNKLGPVYEEDFSMEDIYGASLGDGSNENYILIDKYLRDESHTVLSSKEIEKIKEYVGEKTAVKYVTETINFPTISSNIKSNSSYEDEIKTIRNTIKKHITKYGSIAASVNNQYFKEYNGYTVLNNKETSSTNHGISIIGWDDNFSKENFPEDCRPSTDGAYLALNSYGIAWGDNGCFWISYEDNCVETSLVGVTKVEEITPIISSSMEVIDIDKNENILNSKIKRSDNENVQININLEISNLLENKEVLVRVRDSKQDVTDVFEIKGKEVLNNKVNLILNFETKQLDAGQYIVEIAYGDELISKTFKILQDFLYDFNDNGTIKIIKYNGENKEVIVPNKYEGYTVTAIGDEAFYYNTNLETVTLSEGILSIGKNAFSYCENLKNVNLPNTLTRIGSYAFSCCSSLSNIIIPKSVITIEDIAFGWCENLEKMIIFKETTNIGYIFYATPKVVVYGEENSAALNIAGQDRYAILRYYTINYKTEYSDADMPNNSIKLEYENINIDSKIPSKTGFEFLGWSTKEYSDEISYIPGQRYDNNEDLTLYAVWKDNRKNISRIDVNEEYVFEDATYKYDGTEKNIIATGKTYKKNIIDVKYFIEVNEGGILTGGKAINAGVYTIIAKYTIKDEYKNIYGFKDGIKTRKAILTIEKIDVNMSDVIFKSNEEYIYDGTEKKVEILGQLPEGVTVEYENNTGVNAGEYKAIAKFKYIDTLNYNPIENMETSLTIRKAEGKIEIIDKELLNKIYDKKPVEQLTFNKIGDGNVSIQYYNEKNELLNNAPADAGKYTVKSILEEGTNYTGDIEEVNFEIKKATYNIENVKFENVEYTYDGTEKKIEISGDLPEGVTIKYENNTGTNAGEYEAIAKFIIADEKNYNKIENKTAILKINKANGRIEISNKENLNKTYDGKLTNLIFEKTGDGIIEIKYYKEIKGLYEEIDSSPKDVGIYLIIVVLPETDNYKGNMDDAVFEITKATHDMSKVKFENVEHIYDGTPKEIKITGNLPEGVNVEYENNIGTNVGEYEAIAKFIVEDTTNYYPIENKQAKMKINKATYDMSQVKFENIEYVYDGTEKKIQISGNLPKGVTVEYKNNTGILVGEYKAIADFIIDDPINYNEIESKTAIMKIVQGNGTIIIMNKEQLSKIYDGNPVIELVYQKNGNGQVEIEYYKGQNSEGDKLVYPPTDVGIYTVKVILQETENHKQATDEATFEIKKATYDMSNVKFEDITYEYDGTEKKIEITGDLPDGVEVEYENNTAVGAGKYEAVARFKIEDIENYNLIENKIATLKIEKATYDMSNISFKKATYIYDGTEKKIEIIGDLPEGVEVQYENNTAVSAGIYDAIAIFKVEDVQNYNPIENKKAKLIIKPATYDMSNVKFEDVIYEYDGTEKKIEITGNLPKGVTVEYENNIAINPGEYKAKVKFIIEDSKNYNKISNKEATLKIEKAIGKITLINNLNKVYDGKPIETPVYEKIGDGEVVLEYYKIENTENHKLQGLPIDSGKYILKAILLENDRYTGTTEEFEFEIEKATYNIDNVKFENIEYTYDGTQKEIKITGQLPKGIKVEYENNIGTNAGEYKAIAKFALENNSNYKLIEEEKTAILKINKAQGKIEIINVLGKIYDEKPVEEPIYNKIGDGNVIIEYYDLDKDGSTLETPPINAGKYLAKVILEEGKNYKGNFAQVLLEIEKATYNIDNVKFENTEYIYDGTQKEIKITGKLPKGITVEYENNIGTNVGEYDAIAKFILEDTKNYYPIENKYAKLKINKATYDMSNIIFKDEIYVYDGTQKEIKITGQLLEGITVEYENNIGTNAGEYEAIAKFILEDTKNYYPIENKYAKLKIKKATYDMSNIIFEDALYVYDGTEKKIEISGDLPKGITVEYENNIAINAGEYEAIAKFIIADEKNYNQVENKTAILKISKNSGSILITKIEELNKVYDGKQVQEPTYIFTGNGNILIEYYKGENSTGEKLNSPPVDAGKYTVKVILTETENHNEVTDEASFEITKASYDMSGISFKDSECIYDGIEKKIEIKGQLPEGVSVEYQNNIATNAGSYRAIAKFLIKDKMNYNLIDNMYADLIIEKAQGNVNIINREELSKIYDGAKVINPIYEKTGEGNIKIEYYSVNELEEKLITSPINVGNYKVKVILEESKNYKGAIATSTFEIKKATHDLSNINFNNIEYVYDGAAKQIKITGKLPAGLAVKYQNNTATDVGEYKATAKFILLNNNYNEIEDMTAILKIKQAKGSINIINQNSLNKMYDGKDDLNILYRRTGNGKVNIEYYLGDKAEGKKLDYIPKDVGKYSVKLILEETKNYTGAYITTSFEITKAKYDISKINFSDAIYKYDGTEKKIEITGQLPEGLIVNYENNIATKLGEYEAIAKFTNLDTKNYYDVEDMKAILKIEKGIYDIGGINFADATYEYDGQEKKIEIIGQLPNGVTVSYENNIATEAGIYIAVAKFEIPDKENYNEIQDMKARLKILKAPGSIKITNEEELSKVYDGQPVKMPNLEKTKDGNVRIEYYAEEISNETKLNSPPVDAGKYFVKAILEETKNYTSATDIAAFEIKKLNYDMSNIVFEDMEHIYDGTEKQIKITGQLPEGVTVEYENNTGVNVGEYQAKAKFKIADSKKYNDIEDMSAILKIKQVEGKIKITNEEFLNKTYDKKAIDDIQYEKTGNGNVIVEYYSGEKAEGEKLSSIPINAGIYTVKLILEESDNYTADYTQATFKIEKATYEMSNIIFEDITYKYDGTEKKIEITGQLPEGVTVEYENNTAVEIGEYEAIVNFIVEDTQNYNNIESKKAKLFIIQDSEINFGDLIIIEQDGIKYLENIDEGTTISQLREKISKTISVYKDEVLIENSEETITTGMTIKIENGETIYEYQTIIKGDITGDGKVNDSDLLMLARYTVGCEREKQIVVGARLIASDVYDDEKYATDKDLLKLARDLLE